MNIVIAVLIFGLIILVHEFGHFILAKINGIFVTEFSMGMGKRLISFIPTENGYKFKGFLSEEDFEEANKPLENTIYSIKLLPFGGSCMMLGEDESFEDDRAFNRQGVWARISVVAAGAIFNFILAFVLTMVVVGIRGYDPAIITGVTRNSSAYEAGLEEGDRITKIDNNNISISRDANSHFLFSPLTDKPVEISYERDGIERKTSLIPKYEENYILGFTYLPDSSQATVQSINEGYPMDKAGIEVGDIISEYNGFQVSSGEALNKLLEQYPLDKAPVEIIYSRNGTEHVVNITPEYAGEGYTLGYIIRYGYEDASLIETIKYGFTEVQYNISIAIKSVGMMLSGRAGVNDIAGPIGIVGIIGDTYEDSREGGVKLIFISLANLTIMLSANIGVLNLFPLPALDGGRLVFLFLEVFRRKPIQPEKEGMVHFIGIIALMILMVFILFNDVRRIFPY